MGVLLENFLSQTIEELGLVNYQLDRLYEASISVVDPADDPDYFSLFENVSDEDLKYEITNEEAYEAYTEALDNTIKKIWNIIVRFIKSCFISAGVTTTTEEAKKVVEVIRSSYEDGAQNNKAFKRVIQKGFYLIAGMGTSLNGVELYKAYKSGDTTNFVVHNINKINVDSFPAGGRFRTCIGIYPDNAKPNMMLIKKTLETLNASGVAGIEALGKGKAPAESTNESVDEMLMQEKKEPQDPFVAQQNKESKAQAQSENPSRFGKATGMSDIKEGMQKLRSSRRIKKAVKNMEKPALSPIPNNETSVGRTSLKNASDLRREGSRQLARGTAKAGAIVAGASALALGIVYLVKRYKKNRKAEMSEGNQGIMMATICYINENQPSAQARVRLYTAGNRVAKIDVNGHEKVVALRDELVKMANDLMISGDKVDAGAKEAIMSFATDVNIFFSGLVNKTKAAASAVTGDSGDANASQPAEDASEE